MLSKLILLFGFLASLFLFFKLVRDDIKLISLRIREEAIFDIFLLVSFGALLGARVFYVVFHFEKFGLSFLKWFLFTHFPGLSFFGGILGAGISLWWILKKRNLLRARLFDLAVLSSGPAIILGLLSVGRLIEAIIFLFLSIGLFRIFYSAVIFSRRLNSPGLISLIFLSVFSLSFFTLDFTRGNDKILMKALTLEQLSSLIIFILAFGFFIRGVKKQKL